MVPLWDWMPVADLDVGLAFQVDPLSLVMLLVVTGVGMLIHVFSVGYMREDPGYARYFAYLNLFVFFMLVLVLGASFPILFVGWEGVGLCSYLLIGFWYREKLNADAGKKAFIMNRIGDAGYLIAMFWIFKVTGSLDLRRGVRGGTATCSRSVGPRSRRSRCCCSSACTGKSAQIPLYTWLPDAMAGPTPVSALIHAATMVTAGVYLVARTNVLFAMAPVASCRGGGGRRADGALGGIHRAQAVGHQEGARVLDRVPARLHVHGRRRGRVSLSGIFHLVTHAFFKALLFLGSGSVIHALHHAYHATHGHEDAQDMRNMGGLRRWMPWTAAVMWVATLAIAGVPGFSGFFSKDEILAMTFATGHEHGAVLRALGRSGRSPR